MKKEKIISVRLPRELFDKLDTLCESNYRSVSDYVRGLIVQDLKKIKEQNEIRRKARID